MDGKMDGEKEEAAFVAGSEPGGTQPLAAPNGSQAPPATWDEVFRHARFAGLVEQRKVAEAAAKEATEAARQAQEQRDADQRAAQAAQLESARLRAAYGQRLPLELADRLRGETPEALAADAEALARLVATGNRVVMPTAPGPGAPEPLITPEQMNDPAFVRENAARIWSMATKR